MASEVMTSTSSRKWKLNFWKIPRNRWRKNFFDLDEVRRELVEDLAQEIQDDLELNDLENELDDLSSDDSSEQDFSHNRNRLCKTKKIKTII